MNLRAVKGMNDIIPDEIGRWQRLEAAFRALVERHGYREIRTPVVEPTTLFVRSIGEGTDVVDKEMYSFRRHEEELTLRPEGTAGAARAYLEHRVHNREAVTRWYYIGPMFRGERPARGRYRQFYQAGAEVYGDKGPVSDAEMIDMLVLFLRELSIESIEVVINSLGGTETRARYRDALVHYLIPYKHELSEDSQRRLETNPLRILDSKSESDQRIASQAPSLLDLLNDDDRAHFDALRRHLDALGTPYRVDPYLVRGLDYYTRTLFEIRGAGGELGAQNALCGGGRYDTLIQTLNGPEVPCIGFAMGIERLLLASSSKAQSATPFFYIAPLGETAQSAALLLARELRHHGAEVQVDGRGQKLKVMLHRAAACGARWCLLIGDGELASGIVRVKDLTTHTQEDLPRDQAVASLLSRLSHATDGGSH